jgi:hypothetical protein
MNWIVAFTTPIFLAHSSYGVYFLFGGASALTAIVAVFFMPETRGKSLEDIDASFRRKGAKTEEFELEDARAPDKSVEKSRETGGNVSTSILI